jgi:regulator of PEP synthase PpsR (kinase-PPPase family)
MGSPEQKPGPRTVFFMSDGTGLTAESYGKSLLAQFPDQDFSSVTLAFVDDRDKALTAAAQIDAAKAQSGLQPIVFSTLVGDDEHTIIEHCDACVINLFDSFLEPLEQCFGVASAHSQGMSRTILGDRSYLHRLDAIDYSLAHDDGLRPEQYDEADLILVGVSRCGKTPTSLFLAMNFSLKACNYPLVDDDLERDCLPPHLIQQRDKLVGLTIKPVPLSRIRRKRRPGSDYASLDVCQWEIKQARTLFDRAGLPVFDTTETSIEEIAGNVVKALGISRERTGYTCPKSP